MNRDEILLATLAAADGDFSPVQIQKTMFLLDKKVAHLTGGPHFNFRAYDYGPFDQSIYQSLTNLSISGLAAISGDPTTKQRRYGLTSEGQKTGTAILGGMEPALAKYITELTAWVRSVGFAELVSSIYQEFPDMKANSVFRG